MRGRFKPWAKPFLEAHPEIAAFDVASLDFQEPLDLEIGAGKGDFALARAAANPARRLLALERDISIAGLFAKKALEAGLTNLTILPLDFDDASEGFSKMRFGSIFMNFSDPWPKKKHAKRRLTFAPRLKQIASLLEEKGAIYVKTDNDVLYEFTKEQAIEAGLSIVSDEPDYQLASGDFLTEYESRFRGEGKAIHRLMIQK